MPSSARTDEDPALRLEYYPYRYHTVLRQSDGRGNGHVANGKIATLADDAREDVHTQITGDLQLGRLLHMAESNFRFMIEITYPGDLTIGVGITGIGNSSLRETIGFFRDGRCYVVSKIVLVKTAEGRSAPFTPEERIRAARFMVRS